MRVQVCREIAQGRIGILILFIDQGCDITFSVEHDVPLNSRDDGIAAGGLRSRLCGDQALAPGPLMIWSWVNSANPSSANSVPMPDCLAPPNGICGAISRCLLIQTVPASILLATSWARLMSDDQTDAPRP